MSALERGLNIYIGRSVASVGCGEISWHCSTRSDSKDARRHHCLSQTFTDNSRVLFFFHVMERNMKEWPWHEGGLPPQGELLKLQGTQVKETVTSFLTMHLLALILGIVLLPKGKCLFCRGFRSS